MEQSYYFSIIRHSVPSPGWKQWTNLTIRSIVMRLGFYESYYYLCVESWEKTDKNDKLIDYFIFDYSGSNTNL
jgi:hypothetical protein